ncbi:hypothetical protein TNCV_2077451 [Trichonephila clavipes]|nr:hypothetical protein TNCV_2077451 [Trichonephila clavipes]
MTEYSRNFEPANFVTTSAGSRGRHLPRWHLIYSPNYHTTPTGGRFSSTDLTCPKFAFCSQNTKSGSVLSGTELRARTHETKQATVRDLYHMTRCYGQM